MGNLLSILVVDDEFYVRDMLLDAVGHRYDCVVTSSVGDALDLMQNRRFDLIITDVLLPDCSGLAISLYTKQACYDAPVIVMSGQSSDGLAEQARRNGAFEFLAKPFTLAELDDAVERGLKHRTAAV
jgi:two-component system response regulator AtoC